LSSDTFTHHPNYYTTTSACARAGVVRRTQRRLCHVNIPHVLVLNFVLSKVSSHAFQTLKFLLMGLLAFDFTRHPCPTDQAHIAFPTHGSCSCEPATLSAARRTLVPLAPTSPVSTRDPQPLARPRPPARACFHPPGVDIIFCDTSNIAALCSARYASSTGGRGRLHLATTRGLRGVLTASRVVPSAPPARQAHISADERLRVATIAIYRICLGPVFLVGGR
jgi:hypothetical protein